MSSEALAERLLNLQFNPIELLPWGPNHSVPAGIVLRYPNDRVILVGHDIQGSTSAHFTGGVPWKDELTPESGITWAWVFNS